MRLDQLMKTLCLVKQRSLAKRLCDANKVWVNGKPAKASRTISPQDEIRIEYPSKWLTIEIMTIPQKKSIAKKHAKECYHVLKEEFKKATSDLW